MTTTPAAASGLDAADNGELERLLARGIANDLAEAAWRLIEPAARIVLLAHEHPDPDALGSALGLARALRTRGKVCVVACADAPPSNYAQFLPEVETVVTELADADFGLVIALDAGEWGRYGPLYTRHRAFFDAATTLNFDHHITSRGCGHVNIIDPASAATAELLTLFLLNRRLPIDRETAICLLAGIVTDTRAFEFDATTARTLAAGAYLVSRGAVPQDIIKPMYQMKPLAKARLWGSALASMGSGRGGLLVWAEVSQAMLAETGAHHDMDDGLPSYLIDIDGAAIAVLFKEQRDGTTRASIRTAGPYDAAGLAAHFGGGGHVRAAGCSLALGLQQAKATVLDYAQVVLGASTSLGNHS